MTRLALLLGDPVAHSLSPIIHNAAFRAVGLDAVYRAARTPPHALEAAFQGLRHPDVLGANVTIPHKEAAVSLVDSLDDTAIAVGAVNTIVFGEDGSLIGHNTDVAGFMEPLVEQDLEGSSIVILGSGGAARAAGFGLITMAAPKLVTIAARSVDRAQTVAGDLSSANSGATLQAICLVDVQELLEEADLVVNATPVGMHPNTKQSLLPGHPFRAGQTVYDLVYNPRPSLLLVEASAGGARTIDGLEMLIGQAAHAFRLWTGLDLPRDPVRQALLNA